MPKPSLRILHLEDDPKDAELIQAVLEDEGFICRVTRVDTRADFLAGLEQGGFDLILADYTLPAFDGLSALALALDRCPELPLIFVSGTLGEEVAIEALKIGATDYVLKERLSRIVPSVRRALREAQERSTRKRAERALRRARERALQARFAAVLEERTRLARDIHDTLLQGFTGIALKLVAASGRVTEPPESIAALRDLIGLAQQTLIDARRAVWDLRSPALAGGDFPAALRAAVEDCVRGSALELEFDSGGPPQSVNPEVEQVVVRVAQEAVTNVIKHADARRVRVKLSFKIHRVRLSIIDDGRGFTVESNFQAYGGHWGLLGMRERAIQAGGKLSIRSTPGHGSEVVLLVPYAPGHGSPTGGTTSSSAS